MRIYSNVAFEIANHLEEGAQPVENAKLNDDINIVALTYMACVFDAPNKRGRNGRAGASSICSFIRR